MGIRQRGFTLIVYLALALGILGLLSTIAYHIYEAGADSKQAEWDKANREQRELEAKRGVAASTKVETDNVKAKVITRTITRLVDKLIDRPVYRNICLDADGLCLSNAAIRGESAATCQPDKSVSPVRTTERWDRSLNLALDSGEFGKL